MNSVTVDNYCTMSMVWQRRTCLNCSPNFGGTQYNSIITDEFSQNTLCMLHRTSIFYLFWKQRRKEGHVRKNISSSEEKNRNVIVSSPTFCPPNLIQKAATVVNYKMLPFPLRLKFFTCYATSIYLSPSQYSLTTLPGLRAVLYLGRTFDRYHRESIVRNHMGIRLANPIDHGVW